MTDDQGSEIEIEVADESAADARRSPDDMFGDLHARINAIRQRWSGAREDPNAERIGGLEDQQKKVIGKLGELADSLEALKADAKNSINQMRQTTIQIEDTSSKAEGRREEKFASMVKIMTELIETLEHAPTGPGGGVPKSLLDDIDAIKLQQADAASKASNTPSASDLAPIENHLTELEASIRIMCRVGLRIDYKTLIEPKLAAEIEAIKRGDDGADLV